ncbi:B12-binding domain-containing radical SAM protein [Clostridium sp. FP2]|uniref:B12-binding domain-containing radical SAM protein n=1 Tax=Clostridium TaxID=1485 RepID=UPI0013E98E02|nr:MULTISPECIES: B12-binding domain-containing radical SAM protein [Clostridium]MBW9155169.1 B12-binding domain-containing radical SAM protein [Clostridium tagluense]MBZ9624796.1 B12-binding domain-containing radical SAM protein [Clostridium sp. FP2]WLC64606.1 B12-binding domain-containing radical SAM protein [Clostridium tagluense]
MKVLLVGINSRFTHSNLAIRYLKAFTEDLNYQCLIREFSINDRVERIVQEIIREKADIVVFSCYIWNRDYVKQISDLLKLIDNNIKLLYGGPEVSFDSENYLKDSFADYLIEGEGEETYREFIEYMIAGSDLKDIKGLYYKENDKIFYGGKRKLMDLNKIVFPYNIDDDLNNKIVYFEASRGCPFNCKYCLSSTIRGVRFMDLERVKVDLKFLIDKNVKLIKFVDRTFNCSDEFAMGIWEYLMSLDTETTFHFEISADILNDKQLKLLEKAPKGRFQFEVGVQTTNNEVLKNINRFVVFEDIKKQVMELKKYGNIKQHLDLIAGLPGENFESFKKSFNDLYAIEPDEIQLGFLKILKGAPMKDEAEKWGIVHSNYTPYEVLKTKDISYDEIILLKRVEEMVDKYYNSQKFKTILKYFTPKFESAFDFYLSLGTFFYDKGYLSRSISSVDYYKIFIEFNEEKLKGENFALKEIVKYDYLKYNKKKWLPNFLLRDVNKETEKKIKEKLIQNDSINNTNNIHIEKFMINILGYIENNNICEEAHYLIYDINDEENIRDVTYILV